MNIQSRLTARSLANIRLFYKQEGHYEVLNSISSLVRAAFDDYETIILNHLKSEPYTSEESAHQHLKSLGYGLSKHEQPRKVIKDVSTAELLRRRQLDTIAEAIVRDGSDVARQLIDESGDPQ